MSRELAISRLRIRIRRERRSDSSSVLAYVSTVFHRLLTPLRQYLPLEKPVGGWAAAQRAIAIPMSRGIEDDVEPLGRSVVRGVTT